MKKRRICLNFKSKEKEIKVFECNWFERFLGLMFSRRESAKILLFDFKKPCLRMIHSLFVFFPFVAVWLNSENRVVETRVVRQFCFSVYPKKYFFKLMEVPIDEKYQEILEFLDADKTFK